MRYEKRPVSKSIFPSGEFSDLDVTIAFIPNYDT